MAIPSIQASRRQRSLKAQRRTRVRRWGLILLGLIALLLLAVTLAGPPLLRRELQARLPQELQRDVVVGPLRLNPLTLSLTSREFRVTDRDGVPLVGWARLHVNLQASSLWSGAWVFRNIELEEPIGRLLVLPDGSLNISDLLNRPTPTSEDEPTRAVQVGRLAVSSARLEFEDRSRPAPFATVLGPITFTLSDFSTTGDATAPYRIQAVSESGERFSWQGDFGVAPLRSAGEFALEAIQLPKYAPYLATYLTGQLRSGALSLRGHYEATLTGDQRQVTVSEVRVGLTDLQVALAGTDEPAVQVNELVVANARVQLFPLELHVPEATLTGGRVAAVRQADGSIDLLQLWRTPAAPTEVAPANAEPAPPVELDHLAVRDIQFDWRDATTPRPAQVAGTLDSFEVRELRLPAGPPAQVLVRMSLPAESRISASGNVQLEPLSASLETTIEALPLSLPAPYVEPAMGLHLTQGTLTADGQLRAEWPTNRAPQLQWSGLLGVSRVALTSPADGTSFAQVEQLAVREVDVALADQMRITAGEVELTAPQVQLLRRADGSLNLPQPAPSDAVSAQPAATGAPVAIRIGRTTVHDGSAVLVDRAVEPATRVSISQLQATVGELSSERLDRAEATVTARLQETGQVRLSGQVNPLNPAAATEFTVSVRDVDLQPAAPYVAKYAGYELERGQLQMELGYRIANRQLRAANEVQLDQFTLGAPSGSPDATSLPVPLAVALLKDRQGRIELDVPIEGNLDDPTFRLGRVIGRVIGNLLTKAATSPFALLGALIPGGDEDPSRVSFAPGSAELTDEERTQALAVAKALSERPALRVQVVGSVAPERDGATMRQAEFERVLRHRIWEERRATQPDVPPPAELEISPALRAQALRRWYQEVNPQPLVLTAEQMNAVQQRLAQTSAEQPDQPAPSPGFWKRFFQAFSPRPNEPKTTEEVDPAERARQLDLTLEVVAPDLAVIEDALRETIPLDQAQLTALAQERAQRVQAALIEGGVDAQRVFLEKTATTGPHVTLELR